MGRVKNGMCTTTLDISNPSGRFAYSYPAVVKHANKHHKYHHIYCT